MKAKTATPATTSSGRSWTKNRALSRAFRPIRLVLLRTVPHERCTDSRLVSKVSSTRSVTSSTRSDRLGSVRSSAVFWGHGIGSFGGGDVGGIDEAGSAIGVPISIVKVWMFTRGCAFARNENETLRVQWRVIHLADNRAGQKHWPALSLKTTKDTSWRALSLPLLRRSRSHVPEERPPDVR